MGRPKRFVMAGDNHGVEQHDASVAALFKFMEDYDPDIVVHGGDCFDFAQLRRGAREEEKKNSLEADWETGTAFFKKFFSFGKERHFLRGNHDERMWYLLDSTLGVVADAAKDGVKRIKGLARQHNVKMLPYDAREGVLRLGHLKVLHGFHHGASAARQHAQVYGSCAFFHTHSDDVYRAPGLELREAVNIPALCNDDMEYIRHRTGRLRWVRGWGYGVLFENGTFQLWQCKAVGDTFCAATGIKTY